MSWFTRSISNTFNLNDDEKQEPNKNTQPSSSSSTSPRGVKDDFSDLTQSLTRQFHGITAFLSNPPTKPTQASNDAVAGIRTDLSEIGGKFRDGISKISDNINVSEISKMASGLLHLAVQSFDQDDDDDDKEGVGVSQEVVGFVQDLAMHRETWVQFPFPEEEDEDGFDMTDAQREHALAILQLAPRLAALRMELCPGYMSESCFWMIYFVLLHPKLGKEDAVILSTPQVMNSRAMLVVQLRNESKENLDNNSEEVNGDSTDTSIAQHDDSLVIPSGALSEYGPQKSFAAEPITSTEATNHGRINRPVNSNDIQIVEESASSSAAAACNSEKHPIVSNEIQIADNSIIEVEHAGQNKDQSAHSLPFNSWDDRDEDDADDWLKEETSEIGHASKTTVPIENAEDVSFSDLEDDDEDSSSPREWVQL